MLTTPAIASDPYCAEAPSRSTSMRSMALEGMALRSEVLRHRDLPHRHARRLRHVAEQPHADGVRACRQAPDLVAPLLVTRRVQPAALGGDHRPGERCARRIRNAAPNRAILCQQHRRHDAEYREYFLDSSHNHASWE